MSLTHFDHDGRARFVTFSTHQRLPLLTNNQFRAIVATAIEVACRQFNCRLLAWVIMPEHVHLVLIPPVEVGLSDVIGCIKRNSARQIHDHLVKHNSPLLDRLSINRDGQPRFVFWMKRCFDRNCRSDIELRVAIDYCHQNPVKRGLVKSPVDYPWSSARWYEP